MRFSRRDFLAAAGVAGASLWAGSLLTGCSADEGGPDGPWWLRGNYAPVPDEIEAFDLEVTGSIPPELSGLYVRNGANPRVGQTVHWFLGDGMLHGVWLEDGQAKWYRNRFVRTSFYNRGDDRDPGDEVAENVANTSVFWHGGKLLSLYEAGVPYEMNPTDLSTVSRFDYAGQVKRPLTAHPKLDPDTGELHYIAYSAFPPYLTYHRIDANGIPAQSTEITVPRSTMMHDFQLTERYVVLMDFPVVFELDSVSSIQDLPFRWRPEHGARLGLMPRAGGQVQWFEIDPCYTFHTTNAYDDGDKVILEASRIESLWADGEVENASAPPYAWRWTIDIAAKTVSGAQLDDRQFEFPTIDPRFRSKQHRWAYGMQLVSPEHPSEPTRAKGLLRHDVRSGSWTTFDFGAHEQNDELILVPASAQAAEAEGYLIGFVYDRSRDGSDLVIIDTSRFTNGPIARIRMPRRVPFGFHGTFVPSSEVRS